MHKNLCSIISSKERQQIVVHNVHIRLGDDSKAKTMASDRGKDTFKQKNKKKSERFFWHNIKGHFERCIEKCDQSQKWES